MFLKLIEFSRTADHDDAMNAGSLGTHFR